MAWTTNADREATWHWNTSELWPVRYHSKCKEEKTIEECRKRCILPCDILCATLLYYCDDPQLKIAFLWSQSVSHGQWSCKLSEIVTCECVKRHSKVCVVTTGLQKESGAHQSLGHCD